MSEGVRAALDVLAPFDKHQEVFDALELSLSGEVDEHAALPPDMPVFTWERGAAAAKIATSNEFITRIGAGKKPNARQLVLRALWALLRAPGPSPREWDAPSICREGMAVLRKFDEFAKAEAAINKAARAAGKKKGSDHHAFTAEIAKLTALRSTAPWSKAIDSSALAVPRHLGRQAAGDGRRFRCFALRRGAPPPNPALP